jgi:hypothetical protein
MQRIAFGPPAPQFAFYIGVTVLSPRRVRCGLSRLSICLRCGATPRAWSGAWLSTLPLPNARKLHVIH